MKREKHSVRRLALVSANEVMQCSSHDIRRFRWFIAAVGNEMDV